MKKIITPVLALIMVLALSLPGFSETQQNVIVVTGTATVSLKADYAAIEIGATTRGETVGEAQKENIAIMEQVVAEMSKLGIAREDIHTTQFSVWFDQYSPDPVSIQNRGGSYTVTNMVYITIRDIDKISTVIDAAAAAGTNNIYNLMFKASNSDEAYATALERAVENGRAKAAVLAEATGKTLGGIIRVEANDYPGQMFGMQNSDYVASPMDKETPILSGDVSIVANVVLTFSLD